MTTPRDGRPGPRDVVRLGGAENFRDVAGPGYPTRDGGRVRTGVFFRGGQLALAEQDVGTLSGLGLRGVHDLRRSDEVARSPDPELPGAAWHHHDVLGVAAADAAELTDAAQTLAMMEGVYADFVRNPRSRRALGSLLVRLARDSGPQLFHCTAGKDRTGWAAVLLLRLAGVEEHLVLGDYLRSNELTVATRQRIERTVAEERGPDRVAALAPVLEVRPAYLALSTGLVDAQYGGLDAYLRDGLGLGDADVEALRRRLRD